VLASVGVFVKTQSMCTVHRNQNGEHRQFERWLAFALTPEECTQLRSEPHVMGDVRDGR
jgi:hypothetical protein